MKDARALKLKSAGLPIEDPTRVFIEALPDALDNETFASAALTIVALAVRRRTG